MKAVRFHEFGDADVLRYEDAPRPTAGPGEVLLRVAATSFNPVDDGIRGGWLQGQIPVELPHTPGPDVAGTVEELGAGVTGLQVGDPVIGFLPMDAPGAAADAFRDTPGEDLLTALRGKDVVFVFVESYGRDAI